MIRVMGIWRRDRRALNLESEPGTGILGRWNPVFFFFTLGLPQRCGSSGHLPTLLAHLGFSMESAR